MPYKWLASFEPLGGLYPPLAPSQDLFDGNLLRMTLT